MTNKHAILFLDCLRKSAMSENEKHPFGRNSFLLGCKSYETFIFPQTDKTLDTGEAWGINYEFVWMHWMINVLPLKIYKSEAKHVRIKTIFTRCVVKDNDEVAIYSIDFWFDEKQYNRYSTEFCSLFIIIIW